MNWDQIQGDWKRFKGQIRERWGKLTDDELDTINGKRDQLIGQLQKRYGQSREQAERDLDDFVRAHTEPVSSRRTTRVTTAGPDERREIKIEKTEWKK